MKITACHIQNYKTVRSLRMNHVDSAVILVGKNNCGKSVVMDAIRTVFGYKPVDEKCFCDVCQDIRIGVTLEIQEDDLRRLNENYKVSDYHNYELWFEEFKARLPFFDEKTGCLTFEYVVNPQLQITYQDMEGRENLYIKEVFPQIYYIDNNRDLTAIQEDMFGLQNQKLVNLKEHNCLFDNKKNCNHCFACMEEIEKKSPQELDVHEAAMLLKYKLFDMNLSAFTEKMNESFHKNSNRSQDIKYIMDFEFEKVCSLKTIILNHDRREEGTIESLSTGMRSIYILSLLETYIEEQGVLPSIIMMEEPEIYLHPQMQKSASEILYRLSRKNQVFFTTHAPNMLFDFASRQIKQVVLDRDYYTTVKEDPDIDAILDDLGYTASDLMNVSFIFIVEGKQDSSRLPLLLEKYYSEIYDEQGKLQRIAIIPTNSCTNIKTYANLKYINKLYIKDQFLLIRDSDGKNPKHLVKQLCSYYGERAREDENMIRVKPENVLVLKYYSFENYFLEPSVMAKIGVVKSEEDFYNILHKKYKSYLYKQPSMKRLQRILGFKFHCKQDLKDNIEAIKIYVRGHNLFDIFYGKYKDQQQEIIKKYIDAAPKEVFADIIDAIDNFVFFQSRKKE